MDTGACLAPPSGAGVGSPSAVLVHARLADTPTMGGTGADEDTSIMTPDAEAALIALWQQRDVPTY